MRLRDERAKDMKGGCWAKVNAAGLAPYSIDRVTGGYTVEFNPRTGKSLPFDQWYTVVVTAYDLRHPDGKSERFALLRDAKARARQLKGGE
jgi:hypothetical protein